MKVAVFDTHEFERQVFDKANVNSHDLHYLNVRLSAQTAEAARGCEAVCCFAHDKVDAETIAKLKSMGIKMIALRSAGYNHVDIEAAKASGIPVVRVPEYSPYAIAEHAVGLLLSLNRKIHRAYNRVRELNFSLEGLVGFDLHGKTVGVIGTGRIGKVFCKIMSGFGCPILAYDTVQDPEIGNIGTYVDLKELLRRSDIISLHVPLNSKTRHILDQNAFELMKDGVFLVNTGRGALIDTQALIRALKRKKIGGACLDVYEEEENVFFQDLSERGIDDDLLARLLTFPNVLITAHQAFLTNEALKHIAETTLLNLTAFANGHSLKFRVA